MLAGLLVVQSILAVPAAGETIPVEAFVQRDHLRSLKLSTDGKSLAAVTGSRHEGLAFIDPNRGEVTSTVRTLDGEPIFDFEWISPKRVVLFLELIEAERVQRSHQGNLYVAERGQGKPSLIYQATDFDNALLDRIPNGPPASLVSTLTGRDDDAVLITLHPQRPSQSELPYYSVTSARRKPRLVTFDARGATERLEQVPLPGARVLADHAGQPRFAIGYDRQAALVAMHRAAVNAPWNTFDLPGFRDHFINVQSFTADNRAVTFIAVGVRETLNALYSLDLTSKAVVKLYQDSKADIAEAVTDLKSGAVAGVLVHGDPPTYHWLDEASPTAQLYQVLERRFPQQTVRITSASEDGNKAVLLVSSNVNPGAYYMLDVPSREASFLLAAHKGLDPAQMRTKRTVQIRARDGAILHGYVTQPGASNGPQPMVVLPHDGLPGARDSWSFDASAQLLASRGYAVLQVNFRGSGGYGADFETAGHREWGARMQDDITDAARWAITQGIAARDRICIFGVGYGGYAALMGAVREPALYRCAAGYSGIYDLERHVKDEHIDSYRRGTSRFDDLFFGRDPVRLRTQSPAYNAERIQVPILLIHGKRDQHADFDQAQRMKSALQRAHKPHELLVLQQSKPEADTAERTEAYEKLLAFLERHLARPSPAQ